MVRVATMSASLPKLGCVVELTGPDSESFEQLLAGMDSRGRDFERLCAWFLESDPEYATEFEHVRLWDDWPGNWRRDKGIDLVARTYDSRTIAIQAKHWTGSPYETTYSSGSCRPSCSCGHREERARQDLEAMSHAGGDEVAGRRPSVRLCGVARVPAQPYRDTSFSLSVVAGS